MNGWRQRRQARHVLVLGLLLIGAGGCDRNAACQHGEASSVGVSVQAPNWSSLCQGQRWEANGEAVIGAIDRTTTGVALQLRFTEDASEVDVHVGLPEHVVLPFGVGDAVVAYLGRECPWWENHSVRIESTGGTLLLSGYSGGSHVSPPPKSCDEWLCGRVGYPRIELSHPLTWEDDRAPTVFLKQGGSALLTHGGLTYHMLLGAAFTYTELWCSDTPQTRLGYVVVLVPSD